MKKRILFKVNASSKIGFGHFRRCMALAEILKEEEYILHLQTNKTNPLVKNQSYFLFNSISFVNDELEATDVDLIATTSEAKKLSVEWVVLDGYNFGHDFEKGIRHEGFKLFRIDDLPNHSYDCDVLLSQNYGAEKKKFVTQLGAKKALGLDYVLLSKKFRDLNPRDTFNSILPLKVLITLGGTSEIAKEAYRIILSELNAIPESQIEFTLLVPNEKDLQDLTSINSKVKFFGYSEDMASFMLQSDFVLTTPGTTMWELMYLEIPYAIIPLNQDQDIYSEMLFHDGLCLKLPLPIECKKKDVDDLMTKIMDPLIRKHFAEVSRKFLKKDPHASLVRDLFN